VPDGETVTFLYGPILVGAGTLSGGKATFTTTALPLGTDSITAVYAGDPNFAGSLSNAVSQVVAFPQAATPKFSVAAGTYPTTQTVTISDATPKATIYYTSDGSTPTTSSTPYKDAITVPLTETLQAIATANGYSTSAVATAAYIIGRLTTSVTLQVSPTSAKPGSLFALTASVQDENGNPVANGSVTFFDGTAVLGTVQVVTTASGGATVGTAALETILVQPGANSLTAVYAGGDQSSTSPPVVATVTGQYSDSIQLASSGSPGNYTLTGTVVGAGPLAPTGTFTFTDSTTGLIPGTVTFGSATLAQTFVSAPTITAFSFPEVTALVDVNGDGIPDLFMGDSSGLTLEIGNGDGTFQAPKTILSGGVAEEGIVFGDFNGDGKLDLAVVAGGNLSVLLGNGDGTFNAPASYDTGNLGELAAGDFNGDGILDLVTLNKSGTVDLLLGNGDGTFQQAVKYAVSSPISLTAGDVNGDGIPDVVVATAPSNVSIFLGNTDGTLHTGQTYATQYEPGNMTLADFRGSGKLDLAIVFNQCCEGTNTAVNLMLGNGDGTFQAEQTILSGTNYSGLVAGDFNNDGKLDLVVSDYGYPAVNVLFGNGDGTFKSALSYPAGVGPITPAAADLNHDGQLDIVVPNYNVGTADVLLNEAVQTATLTKVALPGTGTHTVSGTYSGDTNYPSGNSNTLQLAASLVTPTMTLAALPSTTVTWGQKLSVSATLAGPLSFVPAPTGTVSYAIDGGTPQSATLAGATVTIPLAQLSAGAHSVAVTYGGDLYYATLAEQTLALTVNKITPAVTVTPSASSITTAQALTVTAAVSGGSGTPTSTGAVTLTSGKYVSAAATLGSGSATISIPAGSLAVGSDTLTVAYTPDTASSSTYNSATGSSSVTVAIGANPVPVIGSLSPAFTSAGGAAFALTVSGSGFTAKSTVYWGTSALATTYGSATQLTGQVTAADIATSGTTAITVQTPTPGGGTSNSMQFEVDTAGSTTTAPTFTVLTATVTAGSTATYPVTMPSIVESASVTCLNLPTGATCSYSSTTNALTIATSPTTPAGTYQIIVVFTETVSGAATAGILLPILLLPLVLVQRKLTARGIWFSACLGLILMAATAFSIGCGGGGSSSTTTTSTNPTHLVTSSGTVSLTIQ
jgi:hypothetical protein